MEGHGRIHIGLVEEDAALGGLLKEAFSREGYTVTLLEDPRALALVFYLKTSARLLSLTTCSSSISIWRSRNWSC